MADLLPPPRALSPLELSRRESEMRGFVSPFADDSEEEASPTPHGAHPADPDEQATMACLRAARHRLDRLTASEQKGEAPDPHCMPEIDTPEPAAPRTYGGPSGKPRASSSTESEHLGMLQRRRRRWNASNMSLPDMDLKLDLESIPVPSYIDAERRRIRAAEGRLAANDEPELRPECAAHVFPHLRAPGPRSPTHTGSPRMVLEGPSSRGSGPHPPTFHGFYDALEPGEWRWSPQERANKAVPDSPAHTSGRADTALPLAPNLLSTVQAEWSWALSPSSLSASPAPAHGPPTTGRPSVPTRVQ